MLGKLIRHEWKRIWKVPTLLLLILWGGAFISSLTFAGPVFNTNGGGADSMNEAIIVLVAILWVLFFVGSIGVAFGITIYVALQFYYSMYSDEGYLTHTLPVTARQLLIAKGLVMTLWTVLATVGVFVSYLIFGSMAIFFTEFQWAEIWPSIVETAREVCQEFDLILKQYGGSWAGFIIMVIIGIVVSLLFGTAHIIGAITLGQLARKHKIGVAIAAGCIIYAVMSVLEGVLAIPTVIGTNMEWNPYHMVQVLAWLTNLLYMAVTAGLFVVSENIIRKKLNLE